MVIHLIIFKQYLFSEVIFANNATMTSLSRIKNATTVSVTIWTTNLESNITRVLIISYNDKSAITALSMQCLKFTREGGNVFSGIPPLQVV